MITDATTHATTDLTNNWDEAIETFDGMELREELLRGIYAYGFEKPSAIQQRAIKPMLAGRDVIAQAQSGTGKTATFGIGILQSIDSSRSGCQALVLAPTRELVDQIYKVIVALSDFMQVKVHACVGGTAVREDIRALQQGVHMVIGTPGRVYDMIERRAFPLDDLEVFALDEVGPHLLLQNFYAVSHPQQADEMLSMGFKEKIYDVSGH